MRRLESDTTPDNVCATGRNRNQSVIPQLPVLAGVRPTRDAFDDRYSNVGTRLVLPPDRRSSRIGSGRGTRAEPSQSASRRTDATVARMGGTVLSAGINSSYSWRGNLSKRAGRISSLVANSQMELHPGLLAYRAVNSGTPAICPWWLEAHPKPRDRETANQ